MRRHRGRTSAAARAKMAAAAIAAGLIIAQCGCANNAPATGVSRGEDFLLNTHCEIAIFEMEAASGEEKAALPDEVLQAAFRYARSLENLLSRTVPASDVSAVNRAGSGEPVSVGSDASYVIGLGLHYSELSGGLFDITIGAVSELWDFSGEHPSLPESGDIERALDGVGYTGIEWNERSAEAGGGSLVTKANADTHIELGGIAKGYIADRTKDFLIKNGVKTALINFGGNVVVLGNKADGSAWIIAVEQPFSAEENESGTQRLSGEIPIYGGSVVTSGVYERKFVQDEVLYHHILDPSTGYPRESDVLSATVIGPVSADCDALSTICLMLGAGQALELVGGLDGYELVVIRRDGSIETTAGALFTTY